MTFAGEVAQERTLRRTQCITCLFLASLAPKERAEVEAVIADSANPDSAVARAITNRGFKVARSSIGHHRRDHQ